MEKIELSFADKKRKGFIRGKMVGAKIMCNDIEKSCKK